MSYVVGENYAGLSASDYARIIDAAGDNETLLTFLTDNLVQVDGFYIYLGDDMELIEALEEIGFADSVNYYTFLGSTWGMEGY